MGLPSIPSGVQTGFYVAIGVLVALFVFGLVAGAL